MSVGYSLRNLVERCFNKLKNARRVVTRYDKTAESFLGFIDITSNALFTVTAPDEAQLFDRYEDLGVTNLRYPGGSVTEWYFDISDISGGSHERSSGTFQGNTQTLTPFTDFMELAASLGTDVTLVVPTMNGFTQSAGEALLAGTYGERVIDADHLGHVAEFVEAAVATARTEACTRGASAESRERKQCRHDEPKAPLWRIILLARNTLTEPTPLSKS